MRDIVAYGGGLPIEEYTYIKKSLKQAYFAGKIEGLQEAIEIKKK